MMNFPMFMPFEPGKIARKEIEKIIIEEVNKHKDNPKDKIIKISYSDEGVEVILSSGDKINIRIDWNEYELF